MAMVATRAREVTATADTLESFGGKSSDAAKSSFEPESSDVAESFSKRG